MEVKVLEITEWNTPASRYEVAQKGNYRIAKHTFPQGYHSYHGIEGYTFFYVRKPLETTTLLENRPDRRGITRWQEWMVDSPTDYRAMQIYAENSYGRVLTTGLGLGLVTHELCKNSRVESITVVEVSPTVIDLIKGYLPDDSRISIVNDNFWSFFITDQSYYDCIIVDLWCYWGKEQQLEQYKGEVIPASKKLRAKYPTASIVFHGFAGMPDLDTLDSANNRGDDVDPLIYGLSEVREAVT